MHHLEVDGFTLSRAALTDASLARLLAACESGHASESVHHRSGLVYGVRGLLWSSSTLHAELDASHLTSLASAALDATAFPIDAIFFDKRAEANWAVPGHQDRQMPVAPNCAITAAKRNGLDHAEPSVATLTKLLALRIHFDEADAGAGALEVVPGSHQRGVLTSNAIRDIPLSDYRTCAASRGDVLFMRPLLLHRSARRSGPGRRRVLHVVYATEQPEPPLRWRSARLQTDE